MTEKQRTASATQPSRQSSPAAGSTFDVFSLVIGILFGGFAAGALYLAFGGTYHPTLLRMALPVFLAALGVTGLLLSRRT